jgi:hypothetical protein
MKIEIKFYHFVDFPYFRKFQSRELKMFHLNNSQKVKNFKLQLIYIFYS